MYPLSDRFHEIAIQQSPKTVLRVYFIDDTVDCTDDNDVRTNGTLLIGAAGSTDSNGRISMDNGVTFTEYFNPDKNVQMGTAVSSRVSMTLLNYDGALNNWTYGRCKIYLYVYDEDNTTWRVCPMGVYIIDDPSKHKTNLVSISGYDQMQKLDAIADTWWAGLNWAGGITLSQLITSLATQVGVSVSSTTASRILNSTVSFTEPPFSCVSVTYREVLEYIAEATGTVARFDRNGALDLRWFVIPTIGGDPVSLETDTTGNRCISVDIAEYSVARVDLLRGKFAEGDLGVTVGSGTNEYTIQNNLLLSGADSTAIRDKLTPIYNRLYAFAPYNPISASFVRYDWSLEAGDVIYIQNNSTSYKFPIFQQTMVWRGGSVSADLLSDGDAKRPMLDASTRDYYRLDSEMRTITIEADRINLLGYTTINDGFKVNLDGTFEANGATINGAFTSSDTVAGVPFSMQMVGSTFSIMNNANPMFRVQPKADGSFSGRVDMADNNSNNITVDGAGVSVASQINGGVAQTIALNVQGTDPNNRGVLNLFGVKNNRNVSIRLDPTGGSTFGNSFSDSDVTVYGNVSATGNSTVGGNLAVTGDASADDVTVGGVLKETNRIASDRLSTPGWYRVCWLEGGSQYSPIGALGALIRFNIVVYGNDGNNGNHQIDYISTYGTGNRKFVNEQSNGVDTKVDKIRCMRDGNDFYIDIHFTASSNTDVYVFWDFFTALSFLGKLTTENLEPVADAPSGETSLAEYSFASSGVFFGDLYTNGTLLLPFLTVGKAIPANADLHNYRTAGVYYATLAVARTLSNSSITTVPFKLIVIPYSSTGILWQVEIAAYSNCIIAIQYFDGSTWGGWKRLTPA